MLVCRNNNIVCHNLGISGSHLSDVLALDFSRSASSGEFAIDIRDTAVVWINDIEHDQQYRRWSDSLMELLRPTFPGMLRSVRRNLYHLVSKCFYLNFYVFDFNK